MLKQVFSEEGAKAGGKPLGLMPLLRQGEELEWWRPLIIPFRPLVIIFNMLLKSRSGGGLLSRPQALQPVQTNEQVYEISYDEFDRPTRVVIHRQVNER